jgi:hypothetical protein
LFFSPEFFLSLVLLGGFVHSSLEFGEPFSGVFLLGLDGLLLFLAERLEETSLFLKGLLSPLVGFLVSLSGGFLDELGVGVDLEEGGVVVQGVLLLSVVEDLGFLDWLDDGLDLVGIDDSGDISVGEDGSLEVVAEFLFSGVSEGAENVVELGKGGGGPDDESA